MIIIIHFNKYTILLALWGKSLLKIDLKRLSEELNLSPTTVSRALNGYPEVKERTRLRVQEAAQKYNYRPNNKAKSLATGRAMAIGHVIPISMHEVGNPSFTDFISGAGETYSQMGYDMILSIVPDKDEEAAYREMIAKRSVDGVILHGPRVLGSKMSDPRLELLQKIKLPFLMHGRAAISSYDYPWLDVNNKSAFKRATEFLLDLGHKKIALINGLKSMNFAARRKNGYEEALKEKNIILDENLVFHDEMTEPYGYEATMKMLCSKNPPSAILVSSIISAIGVRRAIEENGLKMGKDISVIIHDDELSFFKNGEDVPIFTCTRSSIRKAGKRCAQMLLDIIHDPKNAKKHELWEAQLTIGKSTGPFRLNTNKRRT